MALYKCPGCSAHFSQPPPPEKVCGSLECKRCGARQESVERKSRVCDACGICAICGSVHTVMLKNKGLVL